MRQRADDTGFQYKKVWVGKPFDWSFGQWGLWLMVTIAAGLLLIFIAPSAVVAGGLVWWAARLVSRTLAPESPRTWFRSLLGAATVFLVLLRPDPVAWLLPVPFLLALVLTPVTGYVTVRKVGKYLNWNRNFTYWIRLPGRAAAAPRITATEAIDPNPLALEADLGPDADRTDLTPAVTGKTVLIEYDPPALESGIDQERRRDLARVIPPAHRQFFQKPDQHDMPPEVLDALNRFRKAAEVTLPATVPPLEPFRMPVSPYLRNGPEKGGPETDTSFVRPEPPPLPKAKWFTRLPDGDLYVRTPTRFLPDYRFKIGGR